MRISADWLSAPTTVRVVAAIDAVEPNSVRFVGGCVRNSIMGRPVDDIDLATTLLPDQTLSALNRASIRAIPTGIEHGTITAIVDEQAFEITTLRRDVETDGRRAVVAYSTDWAEDAQRRDFRLNALYADPNGDIYDPTGSGIADAQAGRVIFIGDPDQRLKEDYLRILRFFRFNAWYGQTIDRDGLAACERQANGLAAIARERKWRELSKLFSAPSPLAATQAMAEIGVLKLLLGGKALPASRLADLGLVEQAGHFVPDPLLRLMLLLPRRVDTVDHVSMELRLSNKDRDRLLAWADPDLPDLHQSSEVDLSSGLYRFGARAILDRAIVSAAERQTALNKDFITTCQTWTPPNFPIGGDDALAAGLSGPEVGQALSHAEDAWIGSGFSLGRDELLALLKP